MCNFTDTDIKNESLLGDSRDFKPEADDNLSRNSNYVNAVCICLYTQDEKNTLG